MERKHIALLFALLSLSPRVCAAGYLDRLAGIDQAVLCMVVWFAPAVAVILFALGAFLYSTANPTNRTYGKSYMLNSLAGLFITIAFVGLAVALVPKLSIDKCLGQAEKTCASAGGRCGCPDGQVCKEGSRVSDVSDCPDTCCRICEAETVEEETCEGKGYVCGCPEGWECERELPELKGCKDGKTCCAKCKEKPKECCKDPVLQEDCSQCVNPSNVLCSASGCWVPGCKNCHDISGCHYTGGPVTPGEDQHFWWDRCSSCCLGRYPVKSCDKYITRQACEENPCHVSKGGCVETGCKWTCPGRDFDTGNTCCSAA